MDMALERYDQACEGRQEDDEPTSPIAARTDLYHD